MTSRALARLLLLAACVVAPVQAAEKPAHKDDTAQRPHASAPHSQAKPARKHVGKASVYSRKFEGRKTADGTPFDSESHTAASKTLPLGTTARVTNLENGRSTVVTIKDRGPHVKGRVVDVAPKAARDLGIDAKQGVARVEVTPLAVPGDAKAAAGDKRERLASETKP